jgi:dCTP deaminase
MFLSDKDIHAAVKARDVTLDPFDPKRLQPASYDIRLGNTFIINDPHTTSFIDPVKGIHPNTHTVEIADGESFVLHPRVSILG